MLLHTHDYDSQYESAMPTIEIQVRRRGGQLPITLQAVIDTGADATMLPLSVIRRLNARKSGTALLRGTAGGRHEVDLYTVAIQIAEYRLLYMDSVGSGRHEEVIVGRDILNQFVITLNAPAHVVEIST